MADVTKLTILMDSDTFRRGGEKEVKRGYAIRN